MRSILRFAATSMPLVLVGCATGWFHVGNDFDLNAFTSHVERGVTTGDQVRAWLGTPPATGVNVDTNGQRFDEWTYYFAEGRMSSTMVPIRIRSQPAPLSLVSDAVKSWSVGLCAAISTSLMPSCLVCCSAPTTSRPLL